VIFTKIAREKINWGEKIGDFFNGRYVCSGFFPFSLFGSIVGKTYGFQHVQHIFMWGCFSWGNLLLWVVSSQKVLSLLNFYLNFDVIVCLNKT
jgi:hypothetical protein